MKPAWETWLPFGVGSRRRLKSSVRFAFRVGLRASIEKG